MSFFHALFIYLLAALHGMRDLSSPTRDRTCALCCLSSLNHWTAREVQFHHSLKKRDSCCHAVSSIPLNRRMGLCLPCFKHSENVFRELFKLITSSCPVPTHEVTPGHCAWLLPEDRLAVFGNKKGLCMRINTVNYNEGNHSWVLQVMKS